MVQHNRCPKLRSGAGGGKCKQHMTNVLLDASTRWLARKYAERVPKQARCLASERNWANWPYLASSLPHLAKFDPSSTKLGSGGTNIGETVCLIWPRRDRFRRSWDSSGQCLPSVGDDRPSLAEHWPKLAELGPQVARMWPTSAQVWLNLGQCRLCTLPPAFDVPRIPGRRRIPHHRKPCPPSRQSKRAPGRRSRRTAARSATAASPWRSARRPLGHPSSRRTSRSRTVLAKRLPLQNHKSQRSPGRCGNN